MSILADSQIRDLCQLPSHLVSFEAWLKDWDIDDPSWEQLNGKSRLMMATTVLPSLEPFKLTNAEKNELPVWMIRFINQFAEALKPWNRPPMIEPFFDHQVRTVRRRLRWIDDEDETSEVKVISYGLSSYGYDTRIDKEIKTFTNINGGEVDPKEFDTEICVSPSVFVNDFGSEYILVPPNGFVLATTMEYYRIPKDVTVICLGKSTYARTGLVVNVTPLEAGWEGKVTLELSNTTPLPIRVYLEEGICQFLFFKGEVPCDVSYADRNGKYQGQTNVTLPKV